MFLSFKMCKKIAIIPFLFVTAFLSSCVEQEKVEEFRIKERCIGNVCSLTLIDLNINRSRNIIGKITDHTLSSDTIGLESPTDIEWIFENGKIASKERMANLGLEECVQTCVLNNANPTGAVFANLGPQTVHVTGTISDVNKNQRNIEITHHFITNVAGELPSIVATHNGMIYDFTIDLDDLGLLDDKPAHKWTIMKGDVLIGEYPELDLKFNFDTVGAAGGDYTIIYELINENNPDKSLSTKLEITVDDTYIEALQTLADSMVVSPADNSIKATFKESMSNRSGSTLKDDDTQFNWAIFNVNKAEDATLAVYGSNKDPIKNGSEGMKFSGLSSKTSYQVGLVISHKGRSTELVQSDIISTTGAANLPTVVILGEITVFGNDEITLEADIGESTSYYIDSYKWLVPEGWETVNSVLTDKTITLRAPNYTIDSKEEAVVSVTVTDLAGLTSTATHSV
ncbi:MAG: hypothetical protein ACI9BN_001523, partial [Francisella sp.]